MVTGFSHVQNCRGQSGCPIVVSLMNRYTRAVCLLLPLLFSPSGFVTSQPALTRTYGAFPFSTDIGRAQKGSTTYDAQTKSYRISGGGQDIWGAADDFRFNWRTLTGNRSLSADVHVEQPATGKLAKGVLMFRQSLDPGAPYADIAIHADGHITLQWRAVAGGETKDITLPEHDSVRLRIERKGDLFTATAISGDQKTTEPPSVTIHMSDPVYVGIGVCSHDANALQTVTFSNVSFEPAKASMR